MKRTHIVPADGGERDSDVPPDLAVAFDIAIEQRSGLVVQNGIASPLRSNAPARIQQRWRQIPQNARSPLEPPPRLDGALHGDVKPIPIASTIELMVNCPDEVALSDADDCNGVFGEIEQVVRLIPHGCPCRSWPSQTGPF